jgi:hypothetical protein
MVRINIFLLMIIMTAYSCSAQRVNKQPPGRSAKMLSVKEDKVNGTISVFRSIGDEPVLTQVAKPDERPFIHPIIAPDGKGVLTEYRPAHHPHQTGLYWGLKLVNGRDYFMKWQGDYWKRISVDVISGKGSSVKWQTVYDLLDEKGNTTLTETADWSLKETQGKYLLDLQWKGEAATDITFGKFYVGGLFIRMPWHNGVAGEVVNAAGQRNLEAEGQRAIWTDVGVAVEGRNDWGHIAMFDHPDNKSFPNAWRVDNQLGVGPSRQILGEWKLKKGESETIRYRIVVYTGMISNMELSRLWKDFVCED